MDFTPNQRLTIDLHVGLHSIMSITWDVFLHADGLQYLHQAQNSPLPQQRHQAILGFLREDDGIVVSRFGVAKFLKVYQSTGSIERCPGLSSVTWRIKEVVGGGGATNARG